MDDCKNIALGVNLIHDLSNKTLDNLMKKYPVGCSHVSAIKKEPQKDLEEFDTMPFSAHWMKDMNEFEYIKNYTFSIQ